MSAICLITPPSVFLLDERVFMTLGILRVAACLEQAGYKVEMLDLSGIQNYKEAVADCVKESSSNVFALTATSPQMPAASGISRVIRSHRPNSKIILGGPHATLVNAATKRERKIGLNGRATYSMKRLLDAFDIVVAGDGEVSVFEALKDDAPQIVDADDPRSEMFLTNAGLNELPFPARHLVDVDSYHYSIDGERALSAIFQLGCPFACGFCGGRESPMLRRIRTRTTESVLAEIEHIHTRYGVKGIMAYDDELNVNPQMVPLMHGISDLQKRLGTEFRLRGFIKSQLFTDQQAEAMYAAGFRWILVGFESGSPRILESINKKATREENTRCMEIAKRHGLKTKALMSIGHPGESEETVLQTKEWLLEVQPEDFDVTIITTYPGTPYYDHAVKSKERDGVWTYSVPTNKDRLHSIEVDFMETADYYKGDPDGGYHAYVYTDFVTSEQLVELRDHVERSVRKELGIPFNQSSASMRYEHSMGQSGLPSHILRRSN